MREMNSQVFVVLEAAFAQFGVQLVDIKLEYGIIDGGLCLIDEISGGSFRLWPYRSERPKLDQDNVLSELAPESSDSTKTRIAWEARQTKCCRSSELSQR